MSNISEKTLIASKKWQDSFNNGDAKGCADQYENDAVMNAKPLGNYVGHDAIQQFWQSLIDQGYADVQYIDPTISVIDENTAILKAEWTMNKASGVIHEEVWKMQSDDSVKLHEDFFEILENNTTDVF